MYIRCNLEEVHLEMIPEGHQLLIMQFGFLFVMVIPFLIFSEGAVCSKPLIGFVCHLHRYYCIGVTG